MGNEKITKLSVVENKASDFAEIQNALRDCINRGEVKGIALVVIEEEITYTDYAAGPGLSNTEILGAVEVLKHTVLKNMQTLSERPET